MGKLKSNNLLLPSNFIPRSVLNRINRKKPEGHTSNSPKMSVYKSPLSGHWDAKAPQDHSARKRKSRFSDDRENNASSSRHDISGITPLKKKICKRNRWDQPPQIVKSTLPPKDSADQRKKNVNDNLVKASVPNEESITNASAQGVATEREKQNIAPEQALPPEASATSTITERIRNKIRGTRWDRTTPMRRRSGTKNEAKSTIYEKLKKKLTKLKTSGKRSISPMPRNSVLDEDSTPVGITKKKKKKKRRVDKTVTPLHRRVLGGGTPGWKSADNTLNLSRPTRRERRMEVLRLKKARAGKHGQLLTPLDKFVKKDRVKRKYLNRDVIDLTCEAGPSGLSPWEESITNYIPQVDLDAGSLPRGSDVTVTLTGENARSVTAVGNRCVRRIIQAHASNYVVIDDDESPAKMKIGNPVLGNSAISSIVIDDDSCLSSEQIADESVSFVAAIGNSPSKRSGKRRLRGRGEGNVEEIVLIDGSFVILDSPNIILTPPKSMSPLKSASPSKSASPLNSGSPHGSVETPQTSAPSPTQAPDKSPSSLKPDASQSLSEPDDSLIILEEHLKDRSAVDQPPPCESPDIEILCQKKKVFSMPLVPSKDPTLDVNRRINSLVSSHTSNYIPLNANPMPANPMHGNPMLGNTMLGNSMLGNQLMMVQQWQPSAVVRPALNSLFNDNYGEPSTSGVFGNNYSTPPPRKQTGLRPIIIDGSNVAMGHGRPGSFSSRGLQICIDFFLKKRHKVHAFVPLYRRSDPNTLDSRILDKLEQSRHLIFTPSRFVDGRRIVPYDDRYIVQTAAELGGVIVSKDNYRDLLHENPNFADVIKNRLLMFTWIEDMIMFPPDPLGKDGPSLDQFLRF